MKALPYVKPILPTDGRGPFDDPEYAFDLKYDGFRGVLYAIGGMAKLMSKHGKRLPFRDLELRLASCLRGAEAIIDGEVCSLDPSGRPIFRDLMQRSGQLSYVAFDIMWLDGEDLRDKPLRERREVLKRFIKKGADCIRPAFSIEGKGTKLFSVLREHDLEGMVAKRLDAAYTRRARWIKVKNPHYSQNKGRGKWFRRA